MVLSHGGSVPCIGYMHSIAVQGTVLDCWPSCIKIKLLPNYITPLKIGHINKC